MRAALRLLKQQEARRAAFNKMLERVAREADEKGWLTAEEVDAELREVIAQAKSATTKGP
jgi:antitoxin ParD1/3/4